MVKNPKKDSLDKRIQLQVEDTAPDFTATLQLPDKVEDFTLYKALESGHKVLLIFYPGDDTPGCTKQLCAVRDVYSEFSKYNVKVVGVNQASPESHLRFIQKYNYQFGIIVDSDKTIREKYGAIKPFFGNITTKRGAFLIDTDKKIKFIHWGQQNNEEILQLLKSL
jgi:thioredoxin-dependent peroxiredoxin